MRVLYSILLLLHFSYSNNRIYIYKSLLTSHSLEVVTVRIVLLSLRFLNLFLKGEIFKYNGHTLIL